MVFVSKQIIYHKFDFRPIPCPLGKCAGTEFIPVLLMSHCGMLKMGKTEERSRRQGVSLKGISGKRDNAE